jgi:hypothetical protein
MVNLPFLQPFQLGLQLFCIRENALLIIVT